MDVESIRAKGPSLEFGPNGPTGPKSSEAQHDFEFQMFYNKRVLDQRGPGDPMLVPFKNYRKKRGIYLLKNVEYLEIRELYPAHVQQNYIIAFIKFNIEQCNKPTLCGEFKPRVQALPIMRVKVTPGGRKWGDVGSF